jgi:RNA polymerase sigma factor (sigma-70 family)
MSNEDLGADGLAPADDSRGGKGRSGDPDRHGQPGATPAVAGLLRLCLATLRAQVRRSGLQPPDQEDFFQEVAVKLCRRLREQKNQTLPVSQHLAWLRNVVATTAADLRRWRDRHPIGSLTDVLGTQQEPLSRDENPEDRLERLDWCEHVRAVLEGLHGRGDDLNVSILKMRLFENLDTAEVAERLGLTRKQVADHLWLGLKKLSDALNDPPPPHSKRVNSIRTRELILAFFLFSEFSFDQRARVASIQIEGSRSSLSRRATPSVCAWKAAAPGRIVSRHR